MIEKIIKTIEKNKLINLNDKIIIGFSGGADSATLLFILNTLKKNYNLKLIVVHVNHLLRGEESERDENFVKNICEKLDLKYYIFKKDIKKFAQQNKITEEEAGRFLRYESFNKILKKENGTKIAVAHNKNDQGETVLMRIIRGTGLTGLSGIPYKNKKIIRPLLDISRKEIEEFCKEKNIEYINDSTNNQDIYTRNKIRLKLIPYIEKNFNPNVLENLFNLSEISSEENNYLNILTKEKYKEISEKKNNKVYLNIKKLLSENIVLQRRILRLGILDLNKNIKDISFVNIKNILELLNKQTGKEINLPNKIIAKIQYENLILFIENNENQKFCYDLELNKIVFIKEINKYVTISLVEKIQINNLINCYTKKYSYDNIRDVIQFRSRKLGDKIYFKGINGNKKIKDLFIDYKLPSLERNNVPLLSDGSNIISILGNIKRDSDLYQINEDTKKILYFQIWRSIHEERIC